MKFDFTRTAVALFTYNRPEHTRRTLAGLAETGIQKVYIFQDGLRTGHSPEPHREVAELIRGIRFCEVIYRPRTENFGLAKSIMEGVTNLLREYPEILVLEDDCVPAKPLLTYMATALDRFKDDRRVYSISGYGHPSFPADYPYDVCYSPLPSSWGWATWRDRWEKFDAEGKGWEEILSSPKSRAKFNAPGSLFADLLRQQMSGKVDSWAIRWYLTHFKAGAVCVWPIKSYVQNIGMDGTGVHCPETSAFDVEVGESFEAASFRVPPDFGFDPVIRKAFLAQYGWPTPMRIWEKVKRPKNWAGLFKRAFERAFS
ncbi:MAG: glycosyltransferase [Bdellovibrionales bacterium]|nr:glycosyltransferase [Bdellovibrionales bacterium]